MNAARAQLASISKAEQVTRKADGSTLYEIKGKNSDGTTIELFVTPEGQVLGRERSEEHTSELQSLMRISYAVFCLKKKINNHNRIKYSISYSHKQSLLQQQL